LRMLRKFLELRCRLTAPAEAVQHLAGTWRAAAGPAACGRPLSTKPNPTMYSGPQAAQTRVNLRVLRGKYARGEKLTMVTAYDYPSAVHVRLFCRLAVRGCFSHDYYCLSQHRRVVMACASTPSCGMNSG
jgi:hypothetical protein